MTLVELMCHKWKKINVMKLSSVKG
jgi:hypothetical protein